MSLWGVDQPQLKAAPTANAEFDPELVEAVNQLVWAIADEFVDEYTEALWLNEMLPEPNRPKTLTAGQS